MNMEATNAMVNYYISVVPVLHELPIYIQFFHHYNAFLESLAATLIGSPPLPLFGGLLLCFPTISALRRGREWDRAGFPGD